MSLCGILQVNNWTFRRRWMQRKGGLFMGSSMEQANSTAVEVIERGEELLTELKNRVQHVKEIEEMLQEAAQRAAQEIKNR